MYSHKTSGTDQENKCPLTVGGKMHELQKTEFVFFLQSIKGYFKGIRSTLILQAMIPNYVKAKCLYSPLTVTIGLSAKWLFRKVNF